MGKSCVMEVLLIGMEGWRGEGGGAWNELLALGIENTSSSCSMGGSQCSWELLDRRLSRPLLFSRPELLPGRFDNLLPGLLIEDFDVPMTRAGETMITLSKSSLCCLRCPLRDNKPRICLDSIS